MTSKLETAARELCRIRGINPDQSIPHGAEPDERGFVPAICLYSPAWRLVAREIVAAQQVAQSMEFANMNEVKEV